MANQELQEQADREKEEYKRSNQEKKKHKKKRHARLDKDDLDLLEDNVFAKD